MARTQYVTVKDYNKSMETFLNMIQQNKTSTEELISKELEHRMAEIAVATLPTLDAPKETRYEYRETDGRWRQGISVQDVIRLRGEGREIRIVLEWDGVLR